MSVFLCAALSAVLCVLCVLWVVGLWATKYTQHPHASHRMASPSSVLLNDGSYLPILLVAVLLYLWVSASRDDENVQMKVCLKKFFITVDSLLFMALSKDSKGLGPKYNPDPEKIEAGRIATTSKTMVFIRHGESDWNNIFNKGFGPSFVVRLARALFEEALMMFNMDSKFLDSPLNQEGIEQALELRRFLQAEPHADVKPGSTGRRDIYDVLRGDRDTSVIVSSSLRRAVSTTTLALWPRIGKTREKVIILSSLQEISRNIDTRALSAPKTVANLPFNRISGHCAPFNPDDVFDPSENHGNKTRNFYGIKRLQAFNEWAFQRPESVVIVGGHSLYFKHFFQTYLPHKTTHDAKTKKIANSGVVAFQLHRSEAAEADGTPLYRIDPDSIQVLYGGFTTK